MSCQHYFYSPSQFQRKARCLNCFINAGIRNSPARLSTPPNTTNSGFKALISEAMPIPRSRIIFPMNQPNSITARAARRSWVPSAGDTTVSQLEQLSRLSLLESFFGYEGTVPAGLLHLSQQLQNCRNYKAKHRNIVVMSPNSEHDACYTAEHPPVMHDPAAPGPHPR